MVTKVWGSNNIVTELQNLTVQSLLFELCHPSVFMFNCVQPVKIATSHSHIILEYNMILNV
ncbi:hypothetical protein LINPERPRIM_LOCUS19958, partial [Linum perenne]